MIKHEGSHRQKFILTSSIQVSEYQSMFVTSTL